MERRGLRPPGNMEGVLRRPCRVSGVEGAAPARTLVRISVYSFILAGVCALDTTVTALLVAAGVCGEANPLLSYYLTRFGLAAMCAAKCLLTLVPIALLEWGRRRAPVFATAAIRTALFAYTAGYVCAALLVNLRAIAASW